MVDKKYAVFTMDVEVFTDTECVYQSSANVDADLLDGFDEYIKILDKYGIKSTLFTVGKLAPKISDKLKSCLASGHEIALHNYKHIAPMNMTVGEFKKSALKAKNILEDILGTTVSGFRAPCFSMDKERLEVLRELGFSYDSSNLGFKKANFTVDLDLSDFSMLKDGIYRKDGFYEFSLSKQPFFGKGSEMPISGGGYVRLSNWNFVKSLIWKHINHNNYYVFYLHPFELTHQKIPIIKNLKLHDKYYLSTGIKTYAKKIEYIINMLKKCGYTFVTFKELTGVLAEENNL